MLEPLRASIRFASQLNPRQQSLSHAGFLPAAFLSVVDKLFVTPPADGAHLMRVTMKEAQRDKRRDGGSVLAQCSSGSWLLPRSLDNLLSHSPPGSPIAPPSIMTPHANPHIEAHCASCSRGFLETMRCDTVMLSAVRLFSFR